MTKGHGPGQNSSTFLILTAVMVPTPDPNKNLAYRKYPLCFAADFGQKS